MNSVPAERTRLYFETIYRLPMLGTNNLMRLTESSTVRVIAWSTRTIVVDSVCWGHAASMGTLKMQRDILDKATSSGCWHNYVFTAMVVVVE